MAWRSALAAVLVLGLAWPVQAGGFPVRPAGPLVTITPLGDGRYVLEPHPEVVSATRPQVNSQPNRNLAATRTGGGQLRSKQKTEVKY
jgi:hypothetical protein